jgi:hypothetical protein
MDATAHPVSTRLTLVSPPQPSPPRPSPPHPPPLPPPPGGRHPRGASQKRSMKLRCGCGPIRSGGPGCCYLVGTRRFNSSNQFWMRAIRAASGGSPAAALCLIMTKRWPSGDASRATSSLAKILEVKQLAWIPKREGRTRCDGNAHQRAHREIKEFSPVLRPERHRAPATRYLCLSARHIPEWPYVTSACPDSFDW